MTPAQHQAFARALPPFLLAGLALATLDAAAKYLVRDHSLFVVVWARYFGQMVVVTPFVLHRAGTGFWRTQRLPLQLVRSALLLCATGCFFAGLRYLPLAEGSAVTFLAPVFMILLARPILGERPTRAQWVASCTGFCGILILVRPGSAIFHPAVLLLLAAALCNGLYQLLTRKLQGENPHTTLFYSAIVGAIGLTLPLPWLVAAEIPDPGTAALFVLLGLCAGLGHGFIITAYSRVPASQLSPYIYVGIVWATLYGWLVFGHWPDGWSLLGMAVIVGSGVLLAVSARRGARR
jgi:drug/metabolite transporter (DMT)-like permease